MEEDGEKDGSGSGRGRAEGNPHRHDQQHHPEVHRVSGEAEDATRHESGGRQGRLDRGPGSLERGVGSEVQRSAREERHEA